MPTDKIYECYPLGSIVSLGDSDDEFSGTITAIVVREGIVTYEVGWWDGRTFTERWFAQSDISLQHSASRNATKIGFTLENNSVPPA